MMLQQINVVNVRSIAWHQLCGTFAIHTACWWRFRYVRS